MASPLGHALAGLAIGRARAGTGVGGAGVLAACAVLAVAPDFDFLPGALVGRPALYHQGASHSLAFALLASGVAALALGRERGDALRLLPVLFAAYASHLVIDFFGRDQRPPLGIPLLWPFSSAAFLSPRALLPGIDHAATREVSNAQWLASIASWSNARALLVELLFVGPFLALGELRARRLRRHAEAC